MSEGLSEEDGVGCDELGRLVLPLILMRRTACRSDCSGFVMVVSVTLPGKDVLLKSELFRWLEGVEEEEVLVEEVMVVGVVVGNLVASPCISIKYLAAKLVATFIPASDLRNSRNSSLLISSFTNRVS